MRREILRVYHLTRMIMPVAAAPAAAAAAGRHGRSDVLSVRSIQYLCSAAVAMPVLADHGQFVSRNVRHSSGKFGTCSNSFVCFYVVFCL